MCGFGLVICFDIGYKLALTLTKEFTFNFLIIGLIKSKRFELITPPSVCI